MKAKVNKVTIEIVQDDILSLLAGGIVHSTDTNLSVSPLLLARAGRRVEEICSAIGWCDVGAAVITDAGNLSAQKIIHAVGPRWGEGSERGKLANVTLACLRLAEQNHLKSIALPAISTGSLGYPLENCARTMLSQIINFTFENLRYLRTIILCLDTSVAYAIFKQEFAAQIDGLKSTGEAEVTV
jgi:O-acetyl-ADP-ribose deacetylase